MAFNFNLGAAAKPAGAPAFGAAPAASQPGAFGGFGAPAASTAATTPSSLFGGGASQAQPAAPGGFGGFGAASQAQQPPTSGAFGGFGAAQQASQAQPAAAGGFGGFGAPAASTAAGAQGNTFAFGGAAASKPGGLTAMPAFGGGGFGAPAASMAAKPAGFGGFGAGGFGATTGGFGATTTAANMGFGMGQQQQQQQQAPVLTVPAGYPQQPQPTTPESVLQSLKQAWDPSSPTCQFKHYFYNVVHPSDVNKYAPGPLDDATLYEHAARNNPDPSTLVPALAIGFPALDRRAKAQDQHFMNMRVRLAEIAVTLDKLQARHAAENVAHMAEVRRKLAASAMRVLTMMVQLHVLLNQGTPLRPDEANVRAAIDAAAATLAARASADGAAGDELPLMARLQALWRQVEQVPDGRAEGAARGRETQGGGGLTLADEHQVVQVLASQDKGIAYIVDVVDKDKKEMDRIERALAADMERVGPSGAATGDGPAFKRSRMYY